MILKSFEFQCDFDFDFQITTSKVILILKSSTYDDFAHLCVQVPLTNMTIDTSGL